VLSLLFEYTDGSRVLVTASGSMDSAIDGLSGLLEVAARSIASCRFTPNCRSGCRWAAQS
jgi:hypothetical protein